MPFLSPTRFPKGVATANARDLHGALPEPSPLNLYKHHDDFSRYAAGDWTVTSSSTGTSALQDGVGGQIILTTAATLNDIQANQLTKKSFFLQSGNRAWFWINFALSDATASTFIAGWVDTLATMAPGSGIYFSKAAGSAALNLILNKAGTTSTLAVGTLANATSYTVGWFYNGRSTPKLHVYSSIGLTAPAAFGADPFYGGQRVIAAGAEAASGTDLTNAPAAATGHTIGFGIKAGAAAAKTLTVDYFGAAQEVTRL